MTYSDFFYLYEELQKKESINALTPNELLESTEGVFPTPFHMEMEIFHNNEDCLFFIEGIVNIDIAKNFKNQLEYTFDTVTIEDIYLCSSDIEIEFSPGQIDILKKTLADNINFTIL